MILEIAEGNITQQLYIASLKCLLSDKLVRRAESLQSYVINSAYIVTMAEALVVIFHSQ